MPGAPAVPNDWQTLRLDEVGTVVTGSTPPTANRALYGHEKMFAGPVDLGFSKYVTKTAKRLSLAGFAGSRRFPAGSTLFVCIGSTIGKVGIAKEDLTANQQINAIIPAPKIDPEYLYYAATTLSSVVRSRAGEQAVPLVNKSEFSVFEILVPPLKEQREIACALSDADLLIDALERLTTKKQAIKQGVMQQLLSGETRLPGSTEPWVSTTLGELMEFKNGLNKSSEFFGSGTPIVNFMDVMRFPVMTAEHVQGRVTLTPDEIGRFSARQGDVFFTRTSESVEEIGTAAALVEKIPKATFSGFILRGRPRTDATDSRFLAYYLQLQSVRRQITASATYTTRALTNGRSLSRVAVEIPERSEQVAIAAVLTDVDDELRALRSRRVKVEAVKQGMMQELLTGRTRLPLKEPAA